MNFKDAYKQDYENVRMNADFRNHLAEEMKKTSPKARNIKMYTALAASAAAVALVAGAALYGVSSGDNEIAVQGEAVTSPAVTEGLFSAPQWYDEAKTDDEIYMAFSERLADGTLEKLYCSEGDTFSEEDIVSDTEMADIVLRLSELTPAQEQFSGSVTEYMAVFSDGAIVKFSVSDGGLLKLKDTEAVYRYKE